MFNFNDGLPAIIQPDHATIKSRDRTQGDSGTCTGGSQVAIYRGGFAIPRQNLNPH